jgi:hypothetical protein
LPARDSESLRRRCPAASLTDDLVIEILSRLHARSICRFRCVSTAWRNLLRSPQEAPPDPGRLLHHARRREHAGAYLSLVTRTMASPRSLRAVCIIANFEADDEDQVVRLVPGGRRRRHPRRARREAGRGPCSLSSRTPMASPCLLGFWKLRLLPDRKEDEEVTEGRGAPASGGGRMADDRKVCKSPPTCNICQVNP